MVDEIHSVAIFGKGNVSWHLDRALQEAGIRVATFPSRTPEAGLFKGDECTIDIQNFDCFIIAVADSAIGEVIMKLKALKGHLIIHTSGSVSADVLSAITHRFGVLYPLQTFSKGIPVDFSQVPVFVEASNNSDRVALIKLGNRISGKVLEADSALRLKMHLAAVFASNFPNFMYLISDELLHNSGIDPGILSPLILETARKATTGSPGNSQTGPAKRGDMEVIKKHLRILEDTPEYAEIYNLISTAIINRFNK